MSQRENTENMKNNFRSDGYKCYNECSFAVGVCEKILIKKKMGDSVLQVTMTIHAKPNLDIDLDISNMKRDLVPVLACFASIWIYRFWIT